MGEPNFDDIDAVGLVLTDVPMPPSKIARKAKLDYWAAYRALQWMVAHQFAVAVGNGSWTKYRNRRFGEVRTTS